MAGGVTSDMEHFRALGHSAFVIGYSGAVGKALVAELNSANIFKKVFLIGRRVIPLDVGPEFEQRVVDFDKLDDHKDAFKGLYAGFCCMGATVGSVNLEEYKRINHDYILASAQVAMSQGCKHFTLVSGASANKNSFLSYPRIKGEVEQDIGKINFDRLSIFRPGLIICDREERRMRESVAKVFFKPVIYFFPTAMSVRDKTFARAMVHNAVRPLSSPGKELYNNKTIHLMAQVS